MKNVDFSVLKGKVLTKIEGLQKDNDVVTFYAEDGSIFQMYHEQDCCESVSIEDVCGDVYDLIGEKILVAEENSCSDETPGGVPTPSEYDDSYTWTFYKLATKKGYVDIRWYGTSNGYYSESVDFKQIQEARDEITGLNIIAKERYRQLTVKHYDADHDAEHRDGDLAIAGAIYAMPEPARLFVVQSVVNGIPRLAPLLWPFALSEYKPSRDDRIKELAKAGALIAAEIDRLAAQKKQGGGEK